MRRFWETLGDWLRVIGALGFIAFVLIYLAVQHPIGAWASGMLLGFVLGHLATVHSGPYLKRRE